MGHLQKTRCRRQVVPALSLLGTLGAAVPLPSRAQQDPAASQLAPVLGLHVPFF